MSYAKNNGGHDTDLPTGAAAFMSTSEAERIAAEFAANGWIVRTVKEACEEMERLSAGWRGEAVHRIGAERVLRQLRGMNVHASYCPSLSDVLPMPCDCGVPEALADSGEGE